MLRLNAVAAAGAELKDIHELTPGGTQVRQYLPILTSLRDHPLQKLCVRGYVVDLTGLRNVFCHDTPKS
jgi:hypothetical protein